MTNHTAMRLPGLLAPVALALALALGLLGASSASAGTRVTSTADVATAAAAGCYVAPAAGVDAVSIRTQPNTSATRVGVTWSGSSGYVALSRIDWYI